MLFYPGGYHWLMNWAPNTGYRTAASFTTSGHRCCTIFRMGPAKTISKLHIENFAQGGTSPVYKLELQGITAGSPPTPSGTIISAGANGTFTPTTQGIAIATLGTPYAASAGETLACVCQYSSGTISASDYGRFTIRQNRFGQTNNESFPFGLKDLNVGTWSEDNQGGSLLVEFSDGTALPTTCIMGGSTNTDFRSTDTPDEHGTKFTPTYDFNCLGVWGRYRHVSQSSDCTFKLYDSSDTVLRSLSCEGDKHHMFTSDEWSHYLQWTDGPIQLKADETYRITMLATSTSDMRIREQWVYSQLNFEVRYGTGFSTYVRTSRTDGGSWTDDSADYKLWLFGIIGESIVPPSKAARAAISGGGGIIL